MKLITTLSLGLAIALLSGCHNSSTNSSGSYKVTLTNKTTGQVMAPMAAALHSKTFHVFQEGEKASVGLEHLAEGGAPTELLAELKANPDVYDAKPGKNTEDTVIKPGKTATTTLETSKGGACLSVTSMLVFTNDGFAGADCVDLDGVEAGDKKTINLNTYDAGTEQNTETAATVPGLKGEGFNAIRDDSHHIGVFSLLQM
ncbi:MAG: hypothetical protein FAF03_11955 [Epsilonproteobacteria bacterium]|nr:hypothetical protein [Campylobacterota bacterium]